MTVPRTARAIVAIAALATTLHTGIASGESTRAIKSAGSTLMYPLMNAWTRRYAGVAPSVRVTTDAVGSGAGIAQAIAGTVAIGTSDAYMTDEQMKANPGMLDIPLAISSQVIAYDLPAVHGAALRLDGPTLAAIYTGNVRFWDDKTIASMNPGVALPHAAIVSIHRSDGSGDSFIFSQYLTFSTNSWEDGPSFGTDVAWPDVPGSKGAKGNDAMVQTLATTPGGIAYVGVSFLGRLQAAHLGIASLKNAAGNFVAQSPQSVGSAAAALDTRTPDDERLSLVYAPGAQSYPLVNYEYAIVARKQPDAATASALRAFLTWTIGEGSGNARALLDPLHFAALPDFVRARSDAQIHEIGT